MAKARIIVASLTLSASALIGLAVSEGYTDRAVFPTKNDRPTVGFGSTFHESGAPVQMGDKTDPVRALIKQMVSAEDPKKPLSDSQLSLMLEEQGIQVARRTVAKYREALKIAPANLRKTL